MPYSDDQLLKLAPDYVPEETNNSPVNTEQPFQQALPQELPSASIQTDEELLRLAPDYSPDYGTRPDGSTKGKGFLGELKRPDGNVSTEISIGVPINGKETDIPLLVPTLTKEEVTTLLSIPLDENFNKNLPNNIKQKAIQFATNRVSEGSSPFFSDNKITEKSDAELLSLAPDYKPEPVTSSIADNDTTYTKPETDYSLGDFIEGAKASYQKTALGIQQKALAAADTSKVKPEDIQSTTDALALGLKSLFNIKAKEAMGLSVSELREGGVDVANKFEDASVKAKAEGRTGYALGEITGDVSKAALAPAIGAGTAGAISAFTVPETEALTAKEEIQKGGISAAVGYGSGATIGSLLKTKAAVPVIGGLGGALYSYVYDPEEDLATNAGVGVAAGIGILAAKKAPSAIIDVVTRKANSLLVPEIQKGMPLEEAATKALQQADTIASELGQPKKATPELDEYDMPPSSVGQAVNLTPEEKVEKGIIGKKLDKIKDEDMEMFYNKYYDRFSFDQNTEAKILGRKNFDRRMDAPLTSAIRSSKNMDISFIRAPYKDGWPVWKEDVTYGEALGSKYNAWYFNVVSGNVTPKSWLKADAKVPGGAWVINPNAVSIDSMLSLAKKLKVDPDVALGYVRDLRIAEDFNKIAKVESRNNIFFKAVDEEGNVLGRYLDDNAAKVAHPEAIIQEVKGPHFIRVGVDGQTAGVYESRKLAEQGTRFDIPESIDVIRARIATAEKQSWAVPMRKASKDFFTQSLEILSNDKSGNINKDTAQRVAASYGDYFPAYRKDYITESGAFKHEGIAAKTGIVRAKGMGEGELVSPVQSLMMYSDRVSSALNKNRTLNRKADLWEALGNKDKAAWDEKFATPFEEYQRQVSGLTKKEFKAKEIDDAVNNGEPAEVANSLYVGGLEVPNTKGMKGEKLTLRFYRNGNPVELVVKSPEEIQALKGLQLSSPSDSISKVANGIKNLNRWNITSNPVFATWQFFQDSFTYGIQSRTGMVPLVGTIQGALLSANRNLDKFYKLNTGGGSTWGKLAEARTEKEIQRAINAYKTDMSSVSGVLSKIQVAASRGGSMLNRVYTAPSEIGENAPRQTEFFRYLTKDGKTVAQAAQAAEEVTVPFKTKGSDATLNNLSHYQNFINASLQITDAGARYIKYYPKEFGAKIGVGVVLPALALQQQAVDSLGDNYYKISEDIRNRNIIIAKKDLPEAVQKELNQYAQTIGDTEAIIIPGDSFYYKTFAAPMVAMMSDIRQGTDGAQLGAQMIDGLTSFGSIPNILPVPVDIALSLATNLDYRDAPITSEYLKKLDTSEQYKPNTSLLAREAGKTNLIAPTEMDYVLRSVFGSTHYDLMTQYAIDPALRSLKEYPEKTVRNPADNPLFRRFKTGGDGAMTYDNTYKLYNMMRGFEKEKTRYSDYLKKIESPEEDTRLTAQKWLEKNTDLVNAMELYSDSFDKMGEYVRGARDISNRTELSGEERRQLINEKMLEADVFARDILERFKTEPDLKKFYPYAYSTGTSVDLKRRGAEFFQGVGGKIKEKKDVLLPPITFPNSEPSTDRAPPVEDFFNSK